MSGHVSVTLPLRDQDFLDHSWMTSGGMGLALEITLRSFTVLYCMKNREGVFLYIFIVSLRMTLRSVCPKKFMIGLRPVYQVRVRGITCFLPALHDSE